MDVVVEAGMSKKEELELVARIRIDFKVMPVWHGFYNALELRDYMVEEVMRLIDSLTENDMYVILRPSEWCSITSTGFERKFTKEDYERQYKCGDPGFLIIHNLSFLDDEEDVDWEDKFCKAQQYLLKGLHGSVFECSSGNPQFISTFLLLPQEDFRLFHRVISPPLVSPPTFVLKELPYEWLGDLPSLRQFFQTLAILRDFDVSKSDLLIQFQDYEESCKALKQLCSRSLKKNGDSMMAHYELTLKDLDSLVKPTYNGYNESTNNTEALKLRVDMIEKELKIVKAMMTKSHGGHHI